MAAYKFTFLDEDSKERLEDDLTARLGYIDLLSLLHDLLIGIANQPERPRFSAKSIYEKLADLVFLFQAESQIGIAARANIAVGENLHSSLGRNFSTAEPLKAAKLRKQVDLFLSDLIKEYNLIRNIRTAQGAHS